MFKESSTGHEESKYLLFDLHFRLLCDFPPCVNVAGKYDGYWQLHFLCILRKMSISEEMYLHYHGLIVPKETHSYESLEFAQGFKFEDDDVLAVTYPKSGESFCKTLKRLLLHRKLMTKPLWW